MDISNVPRFNWTVDETNGDIIGKIKFCLLSSPHPPTNSKTMHSEVSLFFNQLDQVQSLLLYPGFLGLGKTMLKENRIIGGVF